MLCHYAECRDANLSGTNVSWICTYFVGANASRTNVSDINAIGTLLSSAHVIGTNDGGTDVKNVNGTNVSCNGVSCASVIGANVLSSWKSASS